MLANPIETEFQIISLKAVVFLISDSVMVKPMSPLKNQPAPEVSGALRGNQCPRPPIGESGAAFDYEYEI